MCLPASDTSSTWPAAGLPTPQYAVHENYPYIRRVRPLLSERTPTNKDATNINACSMPELPSSTNAAAGTNIQSQTQGRLLCTSLVQRPPPTTFCKLEGRANEPGRITNPLQPKYSLPRLGIPAIYPNLPSYTLQSPTQQPVPPRPLKCLQTSDVPGATAAPHYTRRTSYNGLDYSDTARKSHQRSAYSFTDHVLSQRDLDAQLPYKVDPKPQRLPCARQAPCNPSDPHYHIHGRVISNPPSVGRPRRFVPEDTSRRRPELGPSTLPSIW